MSDATIEVRSITPAYTCERRYSTEVGLIISLAGGLVLAALFYVFLMTLLSHTRIGQIFTNRGWVTVVESILASWAVCFMVLKRWQISRQGQLSNENVLPPNPHMYGTPEEIRSLQEELERHASRLGSSLLFRRIRQTVALYSRHPNRAAVSDQLSSLAMADSNLTDSSYSILRVIIWAIPIVGFIGTVVGLGSAVGGFSESLPKAGNFEQLKGLLGGVTSGLSVAFDATFVALLISLLLMFPASILEKRENDLLCGIDEFCHHEVLSRLVDKNASPEISLDVMRKQIEESLKVQQDAFIAYWTTTNEKMASGFEQPMKVINGAAASLAESLKTQQDAFIAYWTKTNEKVTSGLEQPIKALNQAADSLAGSIKVQQDAFITYWTNMNEKIASCAEQPVKTLNGATASLGAALSAMRVTVDAASGQLDRMAGALHTGVEHAEGIAANFNKARSESDEVKNSLQLAAGAARELNANVQTASGGAQEIAKSAASALESSHAAQNAAQKMEEHLGRAGAQLKTELEAALRAIESRHAGAIEAQLGEFRNRISSLNQATQQMKDALDVYSTQFDSDDSGNGKTRGHG